MAVTWGASIDGVDWGELEALYVKAAKGTPDQSTRIALLNAASRREIESTVLRIEKIETALEPAFQEHFVNAMAIPNKIDPFPELAKVLAFPAPRGPAQGEEGGRRRRRREG